ncbi:MAG TPA: hypothetical protein VMS43_06755 [Allosphingosinicella sp.]|nr:hypothetical protein [Allosphingosinicella sp.]
MSHSACNQPTCATVVEGRVHTCPKCGGPMRSVGESPARAILLLICGVLLAGGMGVIMLKIGPSMLNPGVEASDGSSFTGTTDQARLFLTLFAAVFVFGLVAIANGIFMLVTRRQSKGFIIVTLALATVLIILAVVGIRSAKEDQPPPRRTYSTY